MCHEKIFATIVAYYYYKRQGFVATSETSRLSKETLQKYIKPEY